MAIIMPGQDVALSLRERLLQEVTGFYLQSSRFNGLPIRALESRMQVDKQALIEVLKELIQEQLVAAVYGDYHPNPHIRALDDEPIEDQIQKLTTENMHQAVCIHYPPTFRQLLIGNNITTDRLLWN